MRKILTIARQEFIVVVGRKEFILALIGVPLIFIVLPSVLVLFMLASDGSSRGSGLIALIDRAKVIDVALVNDQVPAATRTDDPEIGRIIPSNKFILYEDFDRALPDLTRGKLAAIYVIEPDYLANGHIVAYSGGRGIFSSLMNPGEQRLHNLLRASLVKGRIDENIGERVITPAKLARMHVDRNGGLRELQSNLQKIASIFTPLGMIVLFGSIILMASGYLLQSTAQERESRVMEILLASVKPSELLAGKILGLGAVGLLQAVSYALLIFLPASLIFSIAHVSLQDILLSLIYVVLGYFLFASLMAGTGILGNTVQESTQYSMIWSFLSASPILFILNISHSPSSLLAKGLSYFPLTAPGTMILRIAFSKVPLIDVVISITALILGIYLSIKGAAKVFRVAALMYGKTPSLPEIIRWFREA